MPLSSSHYTSAGLVRPRRSKDKDKGGTPSSSSHRRSKEPSRSRTQTPPRNSQVSSSSLYSQQNTTLDQLPPLPESGTASPGSATSPDLRGCRSITTIPLPLTLPSQLHTPAALQQYLETDEEDEEKLTRSTPSLGADQTRKYLSFRPRSTEGFSQLLDSQTATPLAANTQQASRAPVDKQGSPSFFSQANKLPSPTLTRLSPDTGESNSVSQTASPPPLSASTSWDREYPGAGSPESSHAHPHQHIPFIANSPSYSQVVPYYGPVANDPHYTSAYYKHHIGPVPPAPPAGAMADLQSPPPHAIPSYPGFGPMHQPFPPNQGPPPPMFSPQSGDGFAMSPPPLAGESVKTLDRTNSVANSIDDDAVDLLHRIQNAIPDLTDLMNRYRHTSNQLGARENIIKETEAQKAEKIVALQQKEIYIGKLNKELEAAERRHAADTSKLRLQIGNMEEKHKELHDGLQAHEKTKLGLETAVQALQNEKETLLRAHHEEKSNIQQEYDDRHKSLSDTLARERQQIEEKCQREANATLEARLAECDRLHSQGKAAFEASLARQKHEADAEHENHRQSLEKAVMEKKKDLEEARRRHSFDTHAWQSERAALLSDKESGHSAMLDRFEKEKRDKEAEHQRELQQMRDTWEQEKVLMKKDAESGIAALKSEIEKVKVEREADQIKSNRLIAELEESARRIGEEKDQLSKVVESFGKVTDLRGRGDPF